jgi:single-stranded DNA-binding protein
MYQSRVHLIGYLGKNPEHKSVKTTDRKYAVLSLATQCSWKGADEEWHSKTEWHRIVAWNGLGEYAAATTAVAKYYVFMTVSRQPGQKKKWPSPNG